MPTRTTAVSVFFPPMQVRLWDIRAGVSVRTIPAHSEPISSLNFNADGTLLVTGSYDGLVCVCALCSSGSSGGSSEMALSR